jgi:hypothetical protein
MAKCSVSGCGRDIETHRYLRAEPLKVEDRDGRELLSPIDVKASRFFCLNHPHEAIEEAVARLLPPSEDIPVRLLWSPAPGVKTKAGTGVRERRSRDGHSGVRTAVVRDKGALHMAIPELLPSDRSWFVPHAGAATPKEAIDVLSELLGGDDPELEALRDKIAKLGKGT